MALPPPTLDNTVLVTGASAGIGAELARELARRNYNVVLVARRAERLRELAEELRLSHGVHADVEPCDLTDAGARRALVERLQAGEREVVGVCNNAGFGTVATLLESDLEREQQVVRLNVEAVHHLTGAFLRADGRPRRGRDPQRRLDRRVPAAARASPPTRRARRSCSRSPRRCTPSSAAPA